ncbi:MAG: protein TolQ [Parasphingorhabdus sp.]|uniref:protein TolQ n=1 Tax=Parasphingorhabdus sp. TaxID=2709688 RepID=UPI003003957B
MLDSISIHAASSGFSPLALFLQADIIVKLVMIGLLLASVWTWTIIVSFAVKIGRIASKSDKFEQSFSKADNVDKFYDDHGKSNLPMAKVLAAGMREWRRSTARGPIDREGTRQRLATAMNATIEQEVDKMADRLNFLATVGSVAPFVGLFGTVWGIMRSFSAIAAEQNSSLAVVAPGIAEALFATAIGLFAAIPAVIAYNRFSHRLNKIESRMGRFADGFHATLSRELELGK